MTAVGQVSYSWPQYEDLERRLADTIADSGWEFDQIVGIARGGMFIADCLSRIFDKPIALTVASSYKNKTQKELVLSKEVAMATDRIGQRILLVDDMVDSGTSLEQTKQFLREKFSHITEIRTAVLFRKSGTNFAPDYFVEDIDKKTWIVQPFEKFDQVRLALLPTGVADSRVSHNDSNLK